MRQTYDELIEVATSESFLRIMEDLQAMSAQEQPVFVADVLLDENERERRGLTLPEGVLLQRSAFGDRRPTLFCLKKFLPDNYRDAWENVNLTFDAKFSDDLVSRAPEVSWRLPLDIHHQATLMAAGRNLESA